MGFFRLEHSRSAYFADFAAYGIAITSLAVYLRIDAPQSQWLPLAGLACAGLLTWTLVEYLLHRFILHGLEPFQGWHADHHRRPTALICTPTLLSAGLIAMLVFLPAVLIASLWRACALTLGMLVGYWVYAIVHHATHHWRSDNVWLKQLKRWHAVHHHAAEPGCYGVTSPFWDHVFNSARQIKPRTSAGKD